MQTQSSSDAGEIVLQSDQLKAVIVPEEGGRIASVRSVASGVEFLTQARPGRKTTRTGFDALFQHGPCAGAEECIPTVGACSDSSGRPAPDHGDFWQIPWQVNSCTRKRLDMSALGFSRPLRLERTMEVEAASLLLSYKLVNVGPNDVSCLYAWHPLFAVDAGDRIVLPEEVEDVRLAYSRGESLDIHGKPIGWPVSQQSGRERDLSVAGDPSENAADMVYTSKLNVGRCGLYRTQHRQGIIASFDVVPLPYLGVWLCFGGWPDDRPAPKQVAVALEPTTAPCNTLAEAEQAGLAVNLVPAQIFTWNIRLQLSSPRISYEEFHAQVLASSNSFIPKLW